MRAPHQLNLCRACMQFVRPEELDCPFCQSDLAEAALEHRIRMQQAREAFAELTELLREMGHDVEKVAQIYR